MTIVRSSFPMVETITGELQSDYYLDQYRVEIIEQP
jgi:hypothetical protein